MPAFSCEGFRFGSARFWENPIELPAECPARLLRDFCYDEASFRPSEMFPSSPTDLYHANILAAYVIFGASYLVFAIGKFPGLKIDRPAAAIIGAVGMVAFRLVPPARCSAPDRLPHNCPAVFHDADRRQPASLRLL